MQSQVSEPYTLTAETVLNPIAEIATAEESESQEQVTKQPFWFRTRFIGCMELYADADTVAAYLNTHQGWFRRCAHPMKAEPIGENGYAITIGRFGSFGYEVEPKVGLQLLPPEQGVYRIVTIPVPDYTPTGYHVDFKADQVLVEVPLEQATVLGSVMTRVEWKLDLTVSVWFPKFIQVLPSSLIQKTGDSLLAQIVKQVSRCLTRKVQEDFHGTLGAEVLEAFKKQRSLLAHQPVCQQCE